MERVRTAAGDCKALNVNYYLNKGSKSGVTSVVVISLKKRVLGIREIIGGS